ncbi:DUF4337 family protein [Pseudobacteriovorax antillogorgiicola]|uniref:DUF4337 domain-containing protein n=1 Tax=Pseudobacteriovorax antillogorgiicola TaxID=1513793 RepID=A0A1Y6BSY9_9BACT|nr:DUF4337 family protein [Pseudobacteriovorax antillogorgiicola]TCS53011.1 uncharacterized protein DUF4337 [Pseudobacteriovorax antillogorgiicola]SMF26963.1 protein of unknown function [Pseudobacteriovorax antillogorgiicola]
MAIQVSWRWDRISSRHLEMMYGMSIALFAALLAVVDMQSGAVDTEEIKLVVGQNNAYQWYQAKSIKASLTKSQVEMIRLMAHQEPDREAVQKKLEALEGKLQEYRAEQNEILVGSANLAPEQWVQKVDGVLGKVVGANEYQNKLEAVAIKGETFDRSILWLQLSMVLGALGLLMSRVPTKIVLLIATLFCGLAGAFYGYQGTLL